MISLDLRLEGDGAFSDWADRATHHVPDRPMRVALLKGGMQSGKPSVAIGIELDDGSVVIAETSLELFAAAANAMKIRAHLS